MEIKKYIICNLNDPGAYGYYDVIQYNHIDMLALHLGLTFLKYDPHIDKHTPYSFEDLKDNLFKTGFLLSEFPNLEEFCTPTELDQESQTVTVSSSYPWADKKIPKLMVAFPEYTKEQLKDHEYRMMIDSYLEILEQYLDNYRMKVPYIILYEDETGKVYCEEYFPTDEEKTYHWKIIPSNHAK